MKTNPKWPMHEDNFNIVIGGIILLLVLFFLIVPKLATGI